MCSQSVQSFSHVQLFETQWNAACQASLSITNSQSLLNSCMLSQWCHPTISSSVFPFSCLWSFPASVSSPMSQLFTSGGQSIGVSALASVLPKNIQDWFPLGWTGWISLLSKHHFQIVLGKDSASICWSFTFIYGNKEKMGETKGNLKK